MKLGIFTGSCAVDGKEMYKKAWCTCKVVVLPCQAITYLTFSSHQGHVEIGYLTKFGPLRLNCDQVVTFETWLNIHTNAVM